MLQDVGETTIKGGCHLSAAISRFSRTVYNDFSSIVLSFFSYLWTSCLWRRSTAQPLRMAAHSSISIGIELEFMVAQYENENTSRSDRDDRWACHPPPSNHILDMLGANPSPWAHPTCIIKVCETVATRGYPVGCFHPTVPHPQNSISKNVPPGSLIQVEDQRRLRVWNKRACPSQTAPPSRFDYWVVVREGNIAHNVMFGPLRTTPEGYNWVGMELNSPIFTGPTELDEGISKLRQVLDELRGNLKIWINSNCGLHIHVGDSDKDLSLDVVKRVASLVYLLEEPLLLNLCHSIRQTSPHAAMISLDSRIAKEPWPGLIELDGEAGMHIKELRNLKQLLKNRPKAGSKTINAIHRIWAEPTISNLRAALRKHVQGGGPSSRCGLSISEFNTIEFRYPEASFDTEFISRWAMLVRHIFSIAMRTPSAFGEILYRVYELVTRPETPRWPALSAAIGFNVHSDKWQDRMRMYKYELHDLDAQPILPKAEMETAGRSTWTG